MATSKDQTRALTGLKEAREAVSAMMSEIRSLGVGKEASKLFPYGITKVAVDLKVAGFELSIEVSGPEGGKPGADNQLPSPDTR